MEEAQLQQRYGQYFLNIYENQPDAPDTQPDFPIRMPAGIPVEQAREQAIRAYLDRFSNLEYNILSDDGILVHSVKLLSADGAQVITCAGDLRGAMRHQPAGIVSNFLFFLTEKLGLLYNELRADRPYEQTDACSGHLDYMLCRQTGKETFPLFYKACIAQKQDGSFAFFHFRLGGGSVRVGDTCLSWSADAVDTDAPVPVRVYTPYYSQPDAGAPRETYRKAVGKNRLNLVILQDRITCIRKGDVLLPSVGVVISLEEDHPLLTKLTPLEDGYYSPIPGLSVSLDPPAGFTKDQWAQIRWAYGGGMTLIRDGVGICDDDRPEEHFHREGWLSPLSAQTQESRLHAMVKHPRTALGLTAQGELVILVYSGRTSRSVGADYQDMIRIARKQFPDIRQLVNVDGGGSAVLGLTTRGSFLELSYPSASGHNCTGMARPIHTALYLPISHRRTTI